MLVWLVKLELIVSSWVRLRRQRPRVATCSHYINKQFKSVCSISAAFFGQVFSWPLLSRPIPPAHHLLFITILWLSFESFIISLFCLCYFFFQLKFCCVKGKRSPYSSHQQKERKTLLQITISIHRSVKVDFKNFLIKWLHCHRKCNIANNYRQQHQVRQRGFTQRSRHFQQIHSQFWSGCRTP